MDIYDRYVGSLESDEFTYEDVAQLVDKSTGTIQGWARALGLSPHRSNDLRQRRSVFGRAELAELLRHGRVKILV